MAGRACGRASAIRVDSADVVTHRDLHHAPAVLAFDDLFFPGIQSKYDLGHSYSRSQSILAARRWLAPAVVRSRVVAATTLHVSRRIARQSRHRAEIGRAHV